MPGRQRFGNAGITAELGSMTRGVDRAFHWIEASRIRGLTIEDVLGFGVPRTLLDLYRGYFYGTRELNWPAGRERMFREAGSIITDIFAPGLLAYGVGKVLDKRWNSISNRFMTFQTLELFENMLKTVSTERGFQKKLARLIADGNGSRFEKVWTHLKQGFADSAVSLDDLAITLAKDLGQDHLDVMVQGERVPLNGLLKDARMFVAGVKSRMSQSAQVSWQETAQTLVKNTLKVKRWKLPCVALGFLLTAGVPFFNKWLTRKMDHIDYYVGEIGLNKSVPLPEKYLAPRFSQVSAGQLTVQPASLFESFRLPVSGETNKLAASKPSGITSWMPYLSEKWREGKVWPIVVSLLPLPFAFGFFNTVTRKFMNPLKGGFKGLGKFVQRHYDFGKNFPFTTQQQIASWYALLISARIASARSGNEFRERTLDGVLSWTVWILGTPLIKQMVSRMLDRTHGTQLLKNSGELRSRLEIERLLKKPALQKTLQHSIWMAPVKHVGDSAVAGGFRTLCIY